MFLFRFSTFAAPDQSERFKQAARELGCDDSEERFGEIVTKLAKAGPQHKPKARKAKSAG